MRIGLAYNGQTLIQAAGSTDADKGGSICVVLHKSLLIKELQRARPKLSRT